MRVLGVLLATALLTGCHLVPVVVDGPKECAAEFSAARCLALADIVADQAGRNRGDVTSTTYIPDPPPERPTLGGPPAIRIKVTFRDGTAHEARICGGISGALRPACSEPPELEARSVMGAYHDVPCAGEPPDGCPSRIPAPDPDVVATSEPITIDTRSIPIDRAGPFEVELGEGSLANGILTEASFAFQDAWPFDVALRDGAVFLEVRSLEPDGRPFDNIYRHGTREGVERVTAVVHFDVLWFEPGAELGIRDIVVR